jgi:hypothetical protein
MSIRKNNKLHSILILTGVLLALAGFCGLFILFLRFGPDRVPLYSFYNNTNEQLTVDYGNASISLKPHSSKLLVTTGGFNRRISVGGSHVFGKEQQFNVPTTDFRGRYYAFQFESDGKAYLIPLTPKQSAQAEPFTIDSKCIRLTDNK